MAIEDAIEPNVERDTGKYAHTQTEDNDVWPTTWFRRARLTEQVGDLGALCRTFLPQRRNMCDLLQRLWLAQNKDYGFATR